MNGHSRIFWDLFSCDDRMLVSRQITLCMDNLPWVLGHERRVRDRPINLHKEWYTSCDFDNNSFRKPFVFVWYLELISRKKAGIVVLTTSKQKISKSFTIIVIEGYLHVVLSLTLLDLSISFALFSQEWLEDRLILSSWFVLKQNWP